MHHSLQARADNQLNMYRWNYQGLVHAANLTDKLVIYVVPPV